MSREAMSVLAVLSAMALVVLDAGLINVALPVMARALDVPPADAVLAVSGYQAALVIGLLPCAHLAERFGQRRLFVAGLVLFCAASAACGLAGGLPMLVAARIVQGLGGAAIMALGIALLRPVLGPGRLGRAIGWNALTVALCSAAGPILGALLVSLAPWPWLFFAKLPIGLVALGASAGLPESARSRARVDAPALALHAGAVSLGLVAVGMATARPVAAVLLVLAASGLAMLLVRRQGRAEAPLWPVDLLALRPFRISAIASVLCFIAQSAGMLALPFYLQLGLGRGPMGAGLVMTCWPLSVAITSGLANRLAERFGSAPLCTIGALALGAGLLLSALCPAQAGLAPLVIGAVLSGAGFGLFQAPNNRTLFLSAPADRSAAAGGLQGSARLTGQTLGALGIGLLLAAGPAGLAPRIGFALGAAFAIAAALVSSAELEWPRRRPSLTAAALKGEVP